MRYWQLSGILPGRSWLLIRVEISCFSASMMSLAWIGRYELEIAVAVPRAKKMINV